MQNQKKKVENYLKFSDYFKELELRRIKSMEQVKKEKIFNIMEDIKNENE